MSWSCSLPFSFEGGVLFECAPGDKCAQFQHPLARTVFLTSPSLSALSLSLSREFFTLPSLISVSLPLAFPHQGSFFFHFLVSSNDFLRLSLSLPRKFFPSCVSDRSFSSHFFSRRTFICLLPLSLFSLFVFFSIRVNYRNFCSSNRRRIKNRHFSHFIDSVRGLFFPAKIGKLLLQCFPKIIVVMLCHFPFCTNIIPFSLSACFLHFEHFLSRLLFLSWAATFSLIYVPSFSS